MSQSTVRTTRVCIKCRVEQPLETNFYEDKHSTGGRRTTCKKCINARPPSVSRLVRTRARQRAQAVLNARHKAEFTELYEAELEIARAEHAALQQAASGNHDAALARIRPGRRMPGEKVTDRLDVARCPHCSKHHARGHVCAKCGLAPASSLRLPDDGDLDEIAIERAMNGDAVRLTKAERVEVVRRMAAAGRSDTQIAAALHCVPETVLGWRHTHGIESGWTA